MPITSLNALEARKVRMGKIMECYDRGLVLSLAPVSHLEKLYI